MICVTNESEKEKTMIIARGIIGGILLFLGRELNFLFAGAMAALIGLRLTPILPSKWPDWSDYAFMIALGVIAAAVTLMNEHAGYFISGFLAGAYLLMEYFQPGVLTFPILPFIVGGVFGSLIIGFFTEWALIIISSVMGGYYLATMFRLAPTPRVLVTAGLVIIGAITQAIIMRAQKK
jgi:hypothetical protein